MLCVNPETDLHLAAAAAAAAAEDGAYVKVAAPAAR